MRVTLFLILLTAGCAHRPVQYETKLPVAEDVCTEPQKTKHAELQVCGEHGPEEQWVAAVDTSYESARQDYLEAGRIAPWRLAIAETFSPHGVQVMTRPPGGRLTGQYYGYNNQPARIGIFHRMPVSPDRSALCHEVVHMMDHRAGLGTYDYVQRAKAGYHFADDEFAAEVIERCKQRTWSVLFD